MRFDDYIDGTVYVALTKSDFKSEYRFEQLARFMRQDNGHGIVEIPIDSKRARQEVRDGDA